MFRPTTGDREVLRDMQIRELRHALTAAIKARDAVAALRSARGHVP
jgi:hypothetical protein